MPEQPAGTSTMHEVIDAARAKLDDDLWNYIAGGAETETTLRRNRLALDSLALRPRVLRDVSAIDPGTTLLGRRLRIPVILAPLGGAEALSADGSLSSARAAERFGVTAMISSISEPSLEAVGAASGGAKIAQIYVRGDDAWLEATSASVLAAGYDALALTADTPVYGRRERQLRSGWRPPTHRSGRIEGIVWQSRMTWQLVERLRESAGVPLVIKGIQGARDAELALARGVEVIYVSNHGGRQLDQAQATIDVLREVVDAVGGDAEVVVDGAFMRGTDVLKAVALGARAVAIGRLQAYALAAGGADCLVRVLELLEEEITVAMALLGVSSLAELDASFVTAASAPAAASPLLAAFPPLRGDWPAAG